MGVIFLGGIRVVAVPINGWPNSCCDITPGFLPVGVTAYDHEEFTQQTYLFLQDTYKLPHRLIEKKRRDRINECISHLKDLLPEHLKLTVSSFSSWEG